MSRQPSSSIIMCVEKGTLEYKALLMIMTLRTNWQQWGRVPVYAYSPRRNRQPSDWLKAVYERYEITPVYECLNEDWVDYPLANKPLAMAHAECTLSTEQLLFLDTDILCWKEPTEFLLAPSIDLALSVDGTKTISSSGPDDKYERYWQDLYAIAGVASPPWVTTTLSATRVRSWWISSIIPCRRDAGLMAQWLEMFKQVMRLDLPGEMHYLREQMALCAIAARSQSKFASLALTHNYPVQNYGFYSARGIRPEDAVLWHYQPFLNKFFRHFAEEIDAIDSVDGKIASAQRRIADLRSRYHRLIGLDETLIQKWRRELRLGPRIRRALGRSKPTDPQVN
jgi:hypothetical protein